MITDFLVPDRPRGAPPPGSVHVIADGARPKPPSTLSTAPLT